MKSIQNTDFQFSGQTKSYHGKVRDMHTIGEDLIVAVVSDRISAFDVVMPRGIPFKGQVLNGVATHFLDAVSDIVPTWNIASPDPNVTVGHRCEPIRLEMVIRGYLTGHAWRQYKAGHRVLCGAPMPEGMKEHDRFPTPIVTPATKAEEGHDEDIAPQDILARGIVSQELWTELEQLTRALFQRGTEMAAKQGLILVDTKYEFGLRNGQVMLIDEIHTPDSSRYFYADGYEARQAAGEPQRQLSKEFVREWLMEHDFMGLDGQTPPVMDDAFLATVTQRYVELYEKITGRAFEGDHDPDPLDRVKKAVEAWLAQHHA
ncbi:MAG: phosphoribosylaminoimidazolesuccinocarboxamide synthase [Flavobacteriales bacterium]|nr:phosphoribosylaminoimidazolesuccinocarboxamide synthase [Flavobacteriales bacterium]